MLDLLSDVLARLKIQGTLYFRTSFSPPWGLEVPPYENVARFHFAHRGNCRVRISGTQESVALEQGDLIIIPHGAGHKLLSETTPETDALPLDQVLQETGYSGTGILVHGGPSDGRTTELICGHISLDSAVRHPIFERLPEWIHIRNYGATAGAWMEATLRVISEETSAPRPGGDLIALKMAEALFAQSIRAFLEEQAGGADGLSGFADPQLSRALNAVHQNPADNWTVASLAKAAGMSRTVFAQQFAQKIRLKPMQYVAFWRMQIAQQLLTDTQSSVGDIAAQVGYASESAFARAFKAEIGLTPANFRKPR